MGKPRKTGSPEAIQAQLGLFGDDDSIYTKSLSHLSFALKGADKGKASKANGQLIALSELPATTAPAVNNGGARIEEFPDRGSIRALNGRKRPTTMSARATAAAVVPHEAVVPQQLNAKDSKISRRDRVVMENLPLVKAIAIRVHDSLPVHVELDDLIHAGILGLFDAATKFDPTKNVAFSSYAKHRIKGAILDSLRQLDWASRDMRRRHKQFEQVTRDLSTTLQRQPTEAEVAAKMGVDVARWRQMALDLRNLGLISASTRPVEQEDMPAPDFPCNPDTLPDSMCAREQMRSKLEVAMSVLPERYKKVVVLYYTNEMTMKEIGGLMGINESRVSQIHKSALEKMASALQNAGITSSSVF